MTASATVETLTRVLPERHGNQQPPLRLTWDELIANVPNCRLQGHGTSCLVIPGPFNGPGSWTIEGADYLFTPDWNEVGEFIWTYDVLDGLGQTYKRAVVIRIRPYKTPLSGDWNGDGTTQVAVYETEACQEEYVSSSFLFCESDYDGGSSSVRRPTCTTLASPLTGPGWTPLSGDWDGDGRDEVALYDPEGGWFHLLAVDLQVGTLGIIGSFSPFDTFDRTKQRVEPTFGDWNGDGIDTVGWLDHLDRTLWRCSGDQGSSCFPQATTVPSAVGAAFPLVADWGSIEDAGDSIAIYDQDSDLLWLPTSATSWTSVGGFQVCSPAFLRTPLAGVWGQEPSLGLYGSNKLQLFDELSASCFIAILIDLSEDPPDELCEIGWESTK